MTEPTGSSDPYVAVLADLREQRAKIDQAISVLEALRGVAPRFADGIGASAGAATATAVSQPVAGAGDGEFLGLTIVDAVKKLLTARRRALSNSLIFEELKRGGLVLTSADPVNVISSVLTRRFKAIGDVVRVERGTWGLAEWYPNRNFKKKAEGKAEATNGDSSALAQPSEPPQTVPPEIAEMLE